MKYIQEINFFDFSNFDDGAKKTAEFISNIRIVFKLSKAGVCLYEISGVQHILIVIGRWESKYIE